MPNQFYASLFFVLVLIQPSCQSLKLQSKLDSPATLQVSLPQNDYDFKFLRGYKEIKSRRYYYESSRWVSQNKNVDLYVSYTFLLDNYVFASKKSMEELIKERFEDRLVSIGDEKKITKNLLNDNSEDEIILVGQIENLNKGIHGTGKTVEVNSIVPVELKDASCLYFRRFQTYDANPADFVTGASVFDIQGDAKMIGFLCDYGQAEKSEQVVMNFIRDIKADKVFIDTHLEELKKKNAD